MHRKKKEGDKENGARPAGKGQLVGNEPMSKAAVAVVTLRPRQPGLLTWLGRGATQVALTRVEDRVRGSSVAREDFVRGEREEVGAGVLEGHLAEQLLGLVEALGVEGLAEGAVRQHSSMRMNQGVP